MVSAKSLINTIIVITVTLTLNILYLCWYYANELLKKLRRSTVHQAKSHQIVKKVIVTRNLQAITQVNEDGFGDPSNRYAFSMESFKGKLFVGTSHIKSPIPGIYQFAAGYPLNTEGAQMYSYDDTNNTWKNILAEGFTDKTNFAIRKLKAIDDYLLAVSVNHEKGFEVWGTLNGIDWTCLVGAGFLNKNNSSGRGIEKFGEYVYVTTENRENGAELWRCSSKNIKAALNGKSAEESDSLRHWEKVVEKGFGDSATYWFSDLLVFGDELYMGTMNNIRGFSLFKSKDGKNFTEIAKHGIDSRFNHAAMLLTEFNGELYISTMNWVQGFSVFVMQKRNNEVSFHPVLTKGFNSPHNAYVWQMCEFNGRLYAGSFQNSLFGQRLGMFSLYSSANGRDWEIETDNAFASPLSEKLKFLKYTQKELGDYGIRTLKVHNDRLFIGTATAHGSCKVYMCTTE